VTFQEPPQMEPKMNRKTACLDIHKINYYVPITHTHIHTWQSTSNAYKVSQFGMTGLP